MKFFPFLAPFLSKLKTADIFNFLSVKCFSKGLLFLKSWHIRVNYCWNYGPSNLLFCFFRYRLGHLNNRQTKRKLNNTFFWKLTPKQVFGESFKFFDPQNDNPLIFLGNWTGTDWLFNWTDFLIFPTFKRILLRILWKNLQVSKKTLKILIKFYRFTNVFLKFARKSVLLLKFCQMREISKPQFCWCFILELVLWVILMEMKAPQVGYFQIADCWICYSSFFRYLI